MKVFVKFSGELSHRMDFEEAVASVVALMLLLAVIATFICLYSTEYLPGLKEQSEIAQVSEIKEAFMDFSNDIDHIVSEKKGASYGHTILLGAGDVIMSPEKSGGTLTVTEIDAIVNITASNPSNPKNPDASSGMVKVEYKPSYSFWESQGYNWQYGYINVTKKGIEVPLEYYTMDDALDDDRSLSVFAESFIEFDPVGDAYSGKLASLSIRIANITSGKNAFISGNGATNLKIYSDSCTNKKVYDDPYLTFLIVNSTSGEHTKRYMPEFSGILFDEIEERLIDLNKTYYNDIPVPDKQLNYQNSGYDAIVIDMSTYGSPEPEVAIYSVDISVSAS